MSRYGKSLWSEDARQPFPLEPAHRSRVDRPGDAISHGIMEMEPARLSCPLCPSSQELGCWYGFIQSVSVFHQLAQVVALGTAIWLTPPGVMGHLRKHTEIRTTTDPSCQPNGSRSFEAADRWLGRLLHWFTSSTPSARFAPMTMPWQFVVVCDALRLV